MEVWWPRSLAQLLDGPAVNPGLNLSSVNPLDLEKRWGMGLIYLPQSISKNASGNESLTQQIFKTLEAASVSAVIEYSIAEPVWKIPV